MSELLAAFIADVKDRPEDDTPRLILADWLQERPDEADRSRGEWLRLSCRLARMPRDDPDREALLGQMWELERPHRRRWFGPLLPLWQHVTVRGGLLDLEADQTLVLGEDLTAAAASGGLDWAGALDLKLPADGHFDPEPVARGAVLARFAALHLNLTYGASAERARDFLRALAESPAAAGLRELSATHVVIHDDLLNELLDSPHLAGLTALNLASNGIGKAGAEALARSPLLGRLAALDFSGNNEGTEWVRAIVSSPRTGTLRRLSMRATGLDDAGVALLAGSPLLSGCTFLDIGYNSGVGAEGARSLAASPHLTRLETLAVCGSDVEPAGLRALGESANLPALTSIRVGGGVGGTGDEEVEALAGTALLGRLERLDLSNSQFGERGMAALAAAKAERLRSLNLDSVKLPESAVRLLAGGFDQAQRLTSLCLRGCFLGLRASKTLAGSALLARLRWLDLYVNDLKDDSVRALVTPPGLPEVVDLNLCGNLLRDDGVRVLATASLPRLSRLDLSSNKFGPAAVAALLDAGWVGQLRVLDLHQNRLGDEAARLVTASPALAGLRVLNLSETRLTSAGAQALAESPHLDGVQQVKLLRHRFSRKAVEALRARFGERVTL